MKNLSYFLTLLLLIGNFAFGQSETTENFNNAFSNPTKMNDKQMGTATNFVHQGLKDEEYKKGCARLNNCAEDSGLPLEELIGKGYTMLGMVLGGGIVPKIDMKPSAAKVSEAEAAFKTANSKATQEQVTEAGKKVKGDEKTDWCAVIAMANETIGTQIQTHMQQKAQEKAQSEFTQGDAQLSTLVQLKEMHRARRKTANWQAAAYGTITGCYTAMLIKNASAPVKIKDTWKIGVKLGGAALLTTLFVKKANKHKNAMGVVDDVISKLPKEGACNPYTRTSCFCGEKSSKEKHPDYYQEVCVLNAGNFDEPKFAVGCGNLVNGKISYDKECKCKQTKSCVPPNFGTIGGAFNFGPNLMGTPNDMLKVLNGGEFDEGSLNSYSLGMAAMAKKMKPKQFGGPVPKLNAEQQKIADSLADVLPRELAAIAAASPASNNNPLKGESAGVAGIGNLDPKIKEKLADAISVDYRMGGGGENNYVADDEPEFTMPKLGGEAESSSSTEVISFAEQAISKADVSNAPSTPIFDIISNRYRRSGWQKLQKLQE